MSLSQRLENAIEICLSYDNFSDYLLGSGAFFVPSDPHDMSSMHSYYSSIYAYNKYHKRHPECKLDKKFVTTLLNVLNRDYAYIIEKVYLCLDTQLNFIKSGEATFNISNNDLEELLKKLKFKILKFEDTLKQCKTLDGVIHEEGLYDYYINQVDEISKNIKR